jgi:plasmid rolling circle replication initiator protein Rep
MYEAFGAASVDSVTHPLLLSQISSHDKVWDEHRAAADLVSSFYAGSDFNNYAIRVSFCSQLLDFRLALTGGIKLFSSHFCRVRYCPVCQWRRSLMWKAKAHEFLPRLVSDYPRHRWLFLTLTVKNPPIFSLRETVADMNRAFTRLTQLKVWPGVGWIKSLEVTKGKDGPMMAHPHFHVLLMVRPSYFTYGYLPHRDWTALWRQCLRCDYDPGTHLRPLTVHQQPSEIVPEILKYQTKPSDLVADRDWLVELTRQLHKTRAVAVGGVFRSYMRELEEEPQDLIGDCSEEEVVSDVILRFGWRSRIKKYKLEG